MAGPMSGEPAGMPPGMPMFPNLSGPSTRALPASKTDDDIPDEELEETLAERLWGLTEMFPEPLRNAADAFTSWSVAGVKWSYSKSRSLLWVVTSTATILALPVMFESERATVIEQQEKQQRELMLGPHAAMAGPRPGVGVVPGPPMK